MRFSTPYGSAISSPAEMVRDIIREQLLTEKHVPICPKRPHAKMWQYREVYGSGPAWPLQAVQLRGKEPGFISIFSSPRRIVGVELWSHIGNISVSTCYCNITDSEGEQFIIP